MGLVLIQHIDFKARVGLSLDHAGNKDKGAGIKGEIIFKTVSFEAAEAGNIIEMLRVRFEHIILNVT